MNETENNHLSRTLALIADFYDRQKYGCEGCQGFRKSTDLLKFTSCIKELEERGFLDSERTVFADLGCADGRVNVLMSYFVKRSIGVEIDADILAEYEPRKREVASLLEQADLIAPPGNIHVFAGSSLEEKTYRRVFEATGAGFSNIDFFYTYITLHDVFAEKISAEARSGALYLVYGFNKILPRYESLEIVIPDLASQGIAALYRKP